MLCASLCAGGVPGQLSSQDAPARRAPCHQHDTRRVAPRGSRRVGRAQTARGRPRHTAPKRQLSLHNVRSLDVSRNTYENANTMRVLKIGILTFHRCINYGSYWQARCLVDGLWARGHHAAILDHDSRRINIAEWKCALRPMLPTAVLKADYPLYREKMRRFFRAVAVLPLSPRFPMDHPAARNPTISWSSGAMKCGIYAIRGMANV